jgi:hypothetical protein
LCRPIVSNSRARGNPLEWDDHPDSPPGLRISRGSRYCTELDATRARGGEAPFGGRRERGCLRLEIGRCAWTRHTISCAGDCGVLGVRGKRALLVRRARARPTQLQDTKKPPSWGGQLRAQGQPARGSRWRSRHGRGGRRSPRSIRARARRARRDSRLVGAEAAEVGSCQPSVAGARLRTKASSRARGTV